MFPSPSMCSFKKQQPKGVGPKGTPSAHNTNYFSGAARFVNTKLRNNFTI